MFKVVIASALSAGVVAFYFLVLAPGAAPQKNLEPVKITAKMTNDPGPIEQAAIERELGPGLPPCPPISMQSMRHDEAAKRFNACERNFVRLTFLGRSASDTETGFYGGDSADSFVDSMAVFHCDYVVTRRGYDVKITVDPKAKCVS